MNLKELIDIEEYLKQGINTSLHDQINKEILRSLKSVLSRNPPKYKIGQEVILNKEKFKIEIDEVYKIIDIEDQYYLLDNKEWFLEDEILSATPLKIKKIIEEIQDENN
jgi:hypothetical protein